MSVYSVQPRAADAAKKGEKPIASFLKNPAEDGWEQEEEDRCLSTFSHSPHAVHSLSIHPGPML